MKHAACRGRGQTGHLLRVCRNKSIGHQKKQQQPGKKAVHLLGECSNEDSDKNFTLYTMNAASKSHPYTVNFTNCCRCKSILGPHLCSYQNALIETTG